MRSEMLSAEARERKARRWMRDHSRRRTRFIQIYMANGMDEFAAMVRYDSEDAVMMTQRKVLERIGAITWIGSTALDAPASVVAQRISDIVRGLARVNVFLTGTDHLNDAEFLHRLENHVLADKIRFVPPNASMNEWIDMNPHHSKVKAMNRDKHLPRPSGGVPYLHQTDDEDAPLNLTA